MSTHPEHPVFDRRKFIGRMAAFLAGTAMLGRARSARAATQGTEPYLGEIMLIPFNFPPKGWAFCNGQLLPINQNLALFSLLGTTYGGNGTTNFALPNLQGRVPMHSGQGAGLSPRTLGERAGETAHTLAINELATHSHGIQASSAVATDPLPRDNVPGRNPAHIPQYALTAADQAMHASAMGFAGGGQPHENQQPYLTLNFVIALVGQFPSS